jgi:hypothetical protein
MADSTTRGSTATEAESQASASAEGTSTSEGVDSTSEGCVPQAEVCNGVDDDCNGDVDEGFAVGGRCELGVGSCAAAGTVACDERGSATCDAVPGQPAPEECNRIDDDCNGEIDDLAGACMVGLGVCEAMGTQTCVAGMPTCDAMPGLPSEELCNGLDDDCNGMTDDAALGACLGQAGASSAAVAGVAAGRGPRGRAPW